MSNMVNIQVTEDGARNSCFKVDVTLDSGDMTNYVIWDPLAMYIDYLSPTNSCAIDEIQYAVQNGISVGLYWDAPNPVPIVHLEGRGKFPLDWAGGIPNNASISSPQSGIGGVSGGGEGGSLASGLPGANMNLSPALFASGGMVGSVSGKILLSTFGWTPGQVLSASMFMQVHKTVI